MSKQVVKKSFNETRRPVSDLRKCMIDYLRESKEEKIRKVYKMGYWSKKSYFGIKCDSFVIEATSRLEAIIILKDYLNEHAREVNPSDSFNDGCFDDIVCEYDDIKEEDGVVAVFKSRHIEEIMKTYIDGEFENDSLWLEEYQAPKVLKVQF
jgi:hypothetical protein